METVCITLPPQLKKILDKYVESQNSLFGLDRTEYIRSLIIADLKKHDLI